MHEPAMIEAACEVAKERGTRAALFSLPELDKGPYGSLRLYYDDPRVTVCTRVYVPIKVWVCPESGAITAEQYGRNVGRWERLCGYLWIVPLHTGVNLA